MGWPGKLDKATLAHNVVNEVLISAKTNVAVFQQKHKRSIKNILVPVGGGVHSRLCIQMAYEIAQMERAHITVFHTILPTDKDEDIQDEQAQLEEIIEDELGYIPPRVKVKVETAKTLPEGILRHLHSNLYDLLLIGASDEWTSRRYLFGKVDDWIVEQAPCSVLMVRRYEPVIIHWLHRQMKKVVENNHHK
jgi:nucleotide-binding universal stress UspA family protein